MAVPTVVATNTGGAHVSGGGGGTLTVNLPAGIQADDLLLVFVICNQLAPSFTVTDFTLLENDLISANVNMRIYWRAATGSEGASTSFTANTSYNYNCASIALRGASLTPDTDPYQYAGSAEVYGSSATSPASTSNADDSLVIRWLVSRIWTNTASAPTSHTLQATASGNASYASIRLATQDAGAATGAVSSAAWQSLTANVNWTAGTLVLEAGAAATAPTISSVTLSGTSQIGNTLTATVVTDQDPVDSTAYQWQKAATDDAEPGTDISGKTSNTLALTYSDFGDLLDTAAYVRCQAIATKSPGGASAEVASSWQAVTAPSGGSVVASIDQPIYIVS